MMNVWRSRWAAVGAAVAVTVGAGGIGLVSATAETGERPVTLTIEPERILDTRVDLGLAGRFQNEAPRDLQVTGDVPVASGGVATVVPTGAVAVLVNVTVVDPDSGGFLALRPSGAAGKPTTSTVNFEAGDIVPNSATVDLGPSGQVQVYVKTADPTATADVLVDVVGYTVDHTHDDLYYGRAEVDDLLAGKADIGTGAGFLRLSGVDFQPTQYLMDGEFGDLDVQWSPTFDSWGVPQPEFNEFCFVAKAVLPGGATFDSMTANFASDGSTVGEVELYRQSGTAWEVSELIAELDMPAPSAGTGPETATTEKFAESSVKAGHVYYVRACLNGWSRAFRDVTISYTS